MPPDGKSGRPSTPGVQPGDPREVIFEHTLLGASVRVTAVDCATGAEASVIGPVSAAQRDLERLALGKLKQRISREAEGGGTVQPPKNSGGGILV
ncbi:hypothetical protein [Parvibaculum sp.]|uniref:DUF6898 family protein n=1 Tax=Parvibaculum sp. TaxID=2024848 RepID=UPI00320C7582